MLTTFTPTPPYHFHQLGAKVLGFLPFGREGSNLLLDKPSDLLPQHFFFRGKLNNHLALLNLNFCRMRKNSFSAFCCPAKAEPASHLIRGIHHR
jgi:hypothetical protein